MLKIFDQNSLANSGSIIIDHDEFVFDEKVEEYYKDWSVHNELSMSFLDYSLTPPSSSSPSVEQSTNSESTSSNTIPLKYPEETAIDIHSVAKEHSIVDDKIVIVPMAPETVKVPLTSVDEAIRLPYNSITTYNSNLQAPSPVYPSSSEFRALSSHDPPFAKEYIADASLIEQFNKITMTIEMQRQSEYIDGISRNSLRTSTGSYVIISLHGPLQALHTISSCPRFYFPQKAPKAIPNQKLSTQGYVIVTCKMPEATSNLIFTFAEFKVTSIIRDQLAVPKLQKKPKSKLKETGASSTSGSTELADSNTPQNIEGFGRMEIVTRVYSKNSKVSNFKLHQKTDLTVEVVMSMHEVTRRSKTKVESALINLNVGRSPYLPAPIPECHCSSVKIWSLKSSSFFHLHTQKGTHRNYEYRIPESYGQPRSLPSRHRNVDVDPPKPSKRRIIPSNKKISAEIFDKLEFDISLIPEPSESKRIAKGKKRASPSSRDDQSPSHTHPRRKKKCISGIRK